MAEPGDAILPDVIGADLAILFCGSAAGHASARAGAYYAGPGNRFWPTLAAVGLTPRRLAPAEFRLVRRWGLGLTDLARRAAGPDAEVAWADDPAALIAKVGRYRPRWLAFVGKRAAGVVIGRIPGYGVLPERIGAVAVFVLPSPSGAARAYWDERPWHDLARAAQPFGNAPRRLMLR